MPDMLNWIRRSAEAVCALMMFALFATFMVQIFSRYVMNSSFSWTLELCLTLWIWIVFLGNAFVLRKHDHITFDLLYHAVSPGPRRVFAFISYVTVAGLLLWSLLPTWDWIDFLRIKRSATLQIPMRSVYFVYIIFLVSVISVFAWKAFTIAYRSQSADSWAKEEEQP